MIPRKLRIAVLAGGRSGEHEVSLQSAASVVAALDRARYEVVVVGIDKDGGWRALPPARFLLNPGDPRRIALADGPPVLPPRAGEVWPVSADTPDAAVSGGPVDVVFPALHGTFGEDGTVQGLLELAGVAYVGAGVLGSAVGMDKDVAKRLLRDAGIPVADWVCFRDADLDADGARLRYALERLGLPVFVKPANLGSSVGTAKVKRAADLADAVAAAMRYDTKVLVEEAIDGREIEVSVLGNDDPVASVPGEIVPRHEFYSYAAKYLDENGAALVIPADLPAETAESVRGLAVRAFLVLEAAGMARVDFFLERNTGRLLVNEINTLPGFTKISMYPKLWEASGLPYARLLDRLIDLAIERQQRRARLVRTFRPD
jgi:D-alanine-D-alanine ligase